MLKKIPAGKEAINEKKVKLDLEKDVAQDQDIERKKNAIVDTFMPVESRKSSIVDIERTDATGKVHKYILHVRRAAVISDPIHPKTWAEKRIQNIFIYWILTLVLVALINAVTVYSFVLLPELYSTIELRRIFLIPVYGVCSIVIVELVILVYGFYAFYILVYPDASSWRLGNTRWFLFVILNGYIIFCILGYVRDSRGIVTRIEKSITADFKKNSMTILTNSTQSYFGCCGIRTFTDWDGILKTPGYPSSCCDTDANPICLQPLNRTAMVRLKNGDIPKNVTAIYEDGCLQYESMTAISVIGIFISFSVLFVITSIGCTICMSMILTYVGGLDIQIEQGNPFFD